MPDPKRTAEIGGRERHHQSSEHSIRFLRVAMSEKEATLFVHEQLVKFGGDVWIFASQTRCHVRKNLVEICRPRFAADFDFPWSNLPNVAHGCVDNRLLAPSIWRPLRAPHKRGDLRVGHGKRQSPYTLDLYPGHGHLFYAANEKIARVLYPRQDSLKRFQFPVIRDLDVFHGALLGVI